MRPATGGLASLLPPPLLLLLLGDDGVEGAAVGRLDSMGAARATSSWWFTPAAARTMLGAV